MKAYRVVVGRDHVADKAVALLTSRINQAVLEGWEVAGDVQVLREQYDRFLATLLMAKDQPQTT